MNTETFSKPLNSREEAEQAASVFVAAAVFETPDGHFTFAALHDPEVTPLQPYELNEIATGVLETTDCRMVSYVCRSVPGFQPYDFERRPATWS